MIGAYLDQLDEIAARLGALLATGATPVAERERRYDAFRAGTERLLIVSKVANFSIDLPDAAVAVQVSGTFGSRLEVDTEGTSCRPSSGMSGRGVHAPPRSCVGACRSKPGVGWR